MVADGPEVETDSLSTAAVAFVAATDDPLRKPDNVESRPRDEPLGDESVSVMMSNLQTGARRLYVSVDGQSKSG